MEEHIGQNELIPHQLWSLLDTLSEAVNVMRKLLFVCYHDSDKKLYSFYIAK